MKNATVREMPVATESCTPPNLHRALQQVLAPGGGRHAWLLGATIVGIGALASALLCIAPGPLLAAIQTIYCILALLATAAPLAIFAPCWVRERERGTLESWILAPVRPEPIFRAYVSVVGAPLRACIPIGALLPCAACAVLNLGMDALTGALGYAAAVIGLARLSEAAAARASATGETVPVAMAMALLHLLLTGGFALVVSMFFMVGMVLLLLFTDGINVRLHPWHWASIPTVTGAMFAKLSFTLARGQLAKGAFALSAYVFDGDFEPTPRAIDIHMEYPNGYHRPPLTKPPGLSP